MSQLHLGNGLAYREISERMHFSANTLILSMQYDPKPTKGSKKTISASILQLRFTMQAATGTMRRRLLDIIRFSVLSHAQWGNRAAHHSELPP